MVDGSLSFPLQRTLNLFHETILLVFFRLPFRSPLPRTKRSVFIFLAAQKPILQIIMFRFGATEWTILGHEYISCVCAIYAMPECGRIACGCICMKFWVGAEIRTSTSINGIMYRPVTIGEVTRGVEGPIHVMHFLDFSLCVFRVLILIIS